METPHARACIARCRRPPPCRLLRVAPAGRRAPALQQHFVDCPEDGAVHRLSSTGPLAGAYEEARFDLAEVRLLLMVLYHRQKDARVAVRLPQVSAAVLGGGYGFLLEREQVVEKMVRFRTVGDITCTCPVASEADTVAKIIAETAGATVTERGATRMDDQTSEASMELRKKEGYF